MKRKKDLNQSYYELKKLYNEIKAKAKKVEVTCEDRFEDVPVELSDKDKEGRVIKKGYMDFYMSIRENMNIKDLLVPSGLTSTDKNYANIKFVKDLD
tara:strand:- start:297 stop:587 length:291 start_codon:yes stop_codon:yes gene_type:complete